MTVHLFYRFRVRGVFFVGQILSLISFCLLLWNLRSTGFSYQILSPIWFPRIWVKFSKPYRLRGLLPSSATSRWFPVPWWVMHPMGFWAYLLDMDCQAVRLTLHMFKMILLNPYPVIIPKPQFIRARTAIIQAWLISDRFAHLFLTSTPRKCSSVISPSSPVSDSILFIFVQCSVWRVLESWSTYRQYIVPIHIQRPDSYNHMYFFFMPACSRAKYDAFELHYRVATSMWGWSSGNG